MILLDKKKRPRKLQQGGHMNLIAGVGEEYVPHQYATPGFSQVVKPIPVKRPATGRGSRYGSSGDPYSSDKLAKAAAGGFKSDKDHLYKKRDEVNAEMAQEALDRGSAYYKSPEFRQKYAEQIQYNREIAGLKDKKDGFIDAISKDLDKTEWAIYNDTAFVSSRAGGPELKDIYEVLRGADGYRLLSLGDAYNARANFEQFNGYEGQGQALEQFVINGPLKGELEKLVTSTFKSANITLHDKETLVMKDGTAVPLTGLLNYIAESGTLPLTGEMRSKVSSNRLALNNAVTYLGNTILSKPSLKSAYRNLAISSLMNSGEDLSGFTDQEIEQEIVKEMYSSLGSKMQIFLKEQFADSYKEARAEKAQTTAAERAEKITEHTYKWAIQMGLPDNFTFHEYANYFKDRSSLLAAHVTTIEDPAFLDAVREKEVGATVANAINLDRLIPGDDREAIKLVGTQYPLYKLHDGDGLREAIIPKGSKISILHQVPHVENQQTGVWEVADDYLEMVGYITDDVVATTQATVAELVKQKADVPVDIMDMVREDIWAREYQSNSKFREFVDQLNAGKYQMRDLGMLEVYVPEAREWMRGMFGSDDIDLVQNRLQHLDPDEREEWDRLAEASTTADKGVFSNVYKTLVTFPVTPKADWKLGPWAGMDPFVAKQAEIQRYYLQRRKDREISTGTMNHVLNNIKKNL